MSVPLVSLALVVVVGAQKWRSRSHRARRLTRAETVRGSRLPAAWRDRLGSALSDAEIAVSPDDAVAIWLGGSVATTIIVASFAPPLTAVAALVTVAAAPIGLRLRRHRRVERLSDAVPDILDEVARELRAGGVIGTALDRMAAGGADREEQLAAYRAARATGSTVSEALAAWAGAFDDAPPTVRTAVASGAGALATGASAGGRSAYALEGIADGLRSEVAAAREAHAQGAQGRASAAVLGGLAPASLALSAVVEPEAARVLLTHPVGRAALVVGLSCEVTGVWWMRRILRVR